MFYKQKKLTMKTLKILVGVVLALIAVIVAVYGYYGGFSKVQFQPVEQGGEILVYREFVGDYQQSGARMDEVYSSLLTDYKIETRRGFGIYYDNPETVEASKLRSDLGCILENADSSKIAVLQKSFKVKICPKGNYLVAEFPFKGSLSIFLGIMKVYPILSQYMEENGYSDRVPIMEIYDSPNKKIIYRVEALEK
jgi:DNA gyrase inhibitor GyrI